MPLTHKSYGCKSCDILPFPIPVMVITSMTKANVKNVPQEHHNHKGGFWL